VSFRARLLLASLATLAIGMGAPLVVGNLLLAKRVRKRPRRGPPVVAARQRASSGAR
jgi:hypothetical protein